MKKNIIGQIGFQQSYADSVIKVGEGFMRSKTQDEPYITINDHPVYHISRNRSPFENPIFKVRKVHKWGEYCDPYFMIGMPNVEAYINLYVDTRNQDWYVLWTRISVSPMYFDERIVEYEPIAWMRIASSLNIRLAGYYMFLAQIIHLDGLMIDGFKENWNAEKGRWRDTWFSSIQPEIAFSCIRKTAYQSEEHLKNKLDLAPPELHDLIREKAFIDPEIRLYEPI